MIRELREENEKLKKVLVSVAQGRPIDLKELGVSDLNELIETMDENTKAMDEMSTPFIEKLEAEKERDRQAQKENPQKKMDRRVPHLTNLNEDPQLTGKVYYSLIDCNYHVRSLILSRSGLRRPQERQPQATDSAWRGRDPGEPRLLRAARRRLHIHQGHGGGGARKHHDQRRAHSGGRLIRHLRVEAVPPR